MRSKSWDLTYSWSWSKRGSQAKRNVLVEQTNNLENTGWVIKSKPSVDKFSNTIKNDEDNESLIGIHTHWSENKWINPNRVWANLNRFMIMNKNEPKTIKKSNKSSFCIPNVLFFASQGNKSHSKSTVDGS